MEKEKIVRQKYKIKLIKKDRDGYDFLSGDGGDEDDKEAWGWSKEENALLFDRKKAESIQSILAFETKLIRAYNKSLNLTSAAGRL